MPLSSQVTVRTLLGVVTTWRWQPLGHGSLLTITAVKSRADAAAGQYVELDVPLTKAQLRALAADLKRAADEIDRMEQPRKRLLRKIWA